MTNRLHFLTFICVLLLSTYSLAHKLNSDIELDQFEREISQAAGFPSNWKFSTIEDLKCNSHPDPAKIANEISDEEGLEIFWQMLLDYPKARDSIRLKGKSLLNEYLELAQRSQGKCNLRIVETVAIQFYGSDAFVQINSYLRGRPPQKNKNYDGYIRLLHSGLEKIADFRGVSCRGYHLPPEVLKETLRSHIYEDKAFISTSRLLASANRYAKDGFMKIDIKSCKYIAPLMVYFHEEEILCLPKTQFRVKKSRKFEDKINMILEEIAPN